jgi:hypothetical protein
MCINSNELNLNENNKEVKVNNRKVINYPLRLEGSKGSPEEETVPFCEVIDLDGLVWER